VSLRGRRREVGGHRGRAAPSLGAPAGAGGEAREGERGGGARRGHDHPSRSRAR
jgi:hypothetical protein